MTDSATETQPSSDADVAAAFGIGETDDAENQRPDASEQDQGQDQADEGTEQEEVDQIAALMAEVKELRKVTATLKREQAASRVRSKEKNKVGTSGSGSNDSGPSAEDVAQAEERGREAARLEYGIRLAAAEVRAALATVIPDEQMDDFVDDLALSKFVGEDGEVDKGAIKALKDRQTALLGTRKTPRVNHGRSGTPPKNQSHADQFAEAVGDFFH